MNPRPAWPCLPCDLAPRYPKCNDRPTFVGLCMTSSPPLWKASVTVIKARSADIAAAFELTPPGPQAVLIAEDPFGPDATVEALYPEQPDASLLSTLAGQTVTVEQLPDQDWIRLSQLGLPPVRAGRFFLYGAHDAGRVPNG